MKNFGLPRINFWNNIYGVLRGLNFKIYVKMDWKSFESRKFTVIGAVNIDNLDSVKEAVVSGETVLTEIETAHYRGIYFEKNRELAGLLICVRKEMDTVRQSYTELIEFGRGNGIKNLELIDRESLALLNDQVEFLLLDMLGLLRRELEDIQAVGGPLFSPERVAFWCDTYVLIKKSGMDVSFDFDWRTFEKRKVPSIGICRTGDTDKLDRYLREACLNPVRINTPHYRGLYFEASAERSCLILAPVWNTGNPGEGFIDIYEEKRFGEKSGIENLASLDIYSLIILSARFDKGVMLEIMDYQQELLNKSCGQAFNFERVTFWCNIYFEIKNTGFNFIVKFDWKTFEERSVAVICCIDIDGLEVLKEKISCRKFKIIDIDTLHYRGFYFAAAPGLSGLMLSFRKELIDPDLEIFNSEIMLELHDFGIDHRIADLALLNPLIVNNDCLLLAIAVKSGKSINEESFLHYSHNFGEYVRYYLMMKNDKKGPGENPCHIEIFTWIYFTEIKVMADIVGDEKISIHDVGTNVAQFPLMLSTLSREELFRLDITGIFASDCDWTGKEHVDRILYKNPMHRPLEFISLDLIKEPEKLPLTDVSIANDVFEHMPDEESSLRVLKQLWDKTRRLMIIHVPFENTPDPLWGHHISFNEDKIRNWAGQLDGARFMSDGYFEYGKTLTGYGFLIVIKQRVNL